MFRPAAARRSPRGHAEAAADCAAVGRRDGRGIAAGVDWATRDTLIITRVANGAPKLDGVLDDAVWSKARPVYDRHAAGREPRRHRRVDRRGTRRARRQKIYFAFQWNDPTRSMRRIPMIKKADGWHVLHDRADIADVNDFYEDKLAVGFSRLADVRRRRHRSSAPNRSPTSRRRCTSAAITTPTDGNLMDVWQWKASRGGHLGYVDDQYFGSAARRRRRPRRPARRATRPATGTIPAAPSTATTMRASRPGGFRGPVKVQRLPKDWKATQAALGKFDLNPNSMRRREGATLVDDERPRRSRTRTKWTPRSRSAPSCPAC